MDLEHTSATPPRSPPARFLPHLPRAPQVVKVAAGKRTQAELEDTILHLLSTATGSLLDNVTLINTLDQSKTTWEEVNASLLVREGEGGGVCVPWVT